MLISYSHKFIFIHIYKAAGTSITRALQEYAYEPPSEARYNAIQKMLKHFDYYKLKVFADHVQARDVKSVLPARIYDRFFKFAFVRNPWDWQVSLYHYMMTNPRHPDHSFIQSLSGFDQYIEWRISQSLRLQKDFVTDDRGNVIVDYIGKYESLAENFSEVCRLLNVDASLPHLMKSNHEDYRTYYNATTRNLVAQCYEQDIQLFGYEF
jgi:hypothetical protein